MGKVYATNYQVPFYHSDAQGRMTIPSLLNVALNISGEQSILLGRSEAWTREHHHLFWVITEYHLEVVRLPEFLENLRIETEAVDYNKIFCHRDFRFFDEAGTLILTIRSTWVLIHEETRKITKIKAEIVAPYEAVETRKITRGHHFQSFKTIEDKDNLIQRNYWIRFSDIDMNQHVNNSKYYDWATDPMGYDFLINHSPSEIFIKYQHEVLYGDEIESSCFRKGNSSYHSINQDKCQLEIIWQENEK